MNVKDDKFSNNHIKPANSADIRYLEVDISKINTVPILAALEPPCLYLNPIFTIDLEIVWIIFYVNLHLSSLVSILTSVSQPHILYSCIHSFILLVNMKSTTKYHKVPNLWRGDCERVYLLLYSIAVRTLLHAPPLC